MDRVGSLLKLIRDFKCKVVAEVGVYRGFLSEGILRNLSPVELDFYYMIDPWQVYVDANSIAITAATCEEMEFYYQEVKSRVACDSRAKIMRLTSEVASCLFEDGSLDLVFIDANHEYESVKSDIKLWQPKVKKGGILAGHDYALIPGVTAAVDELIGVKAKFLPDHQFAVSCPAGWEKAVWYAVEGLA